MPALLAQVIQYDVGAFVRQPALRMQLYLQHKTQIAEHERERGRQCVKVIFAIQPQIRIGLALAGVDETMHSDARGKSVKPKG